MKGNGIFPKSIWITDDHSVIRRTLREWLQAEFPELVIEEASSGEIILESLAPGNLPELILMDFHLPGMSGLDATRIIKEKYPFLPILMLTIQEDRQYIDRALEAGIDGYVIKRLMYTDLIPKIQEVFTASRGDGGQAREEMGSD